VISSGGVHVLIAGFALLAVIVFLAMRHGEAVGTVRGKLHNPFIAGREVAVTVRRTTRSGAPTVKLQLTHFSAMAAVSLDAAQACQLADILDAAAARSGG
jgi:hypothetical protein